jgi:RNA polymerase sigma factor (sigma-70 family)
MARHTSPNYRQPRDAPRAFDRPPRRSAARGDERELFERHHDELVRLLERTMRASREEAEDACQFAWLQLLRYQPDDRSRVAGWVYVVARRQLLEARRRHLPVTADVELVERAPAFAGDPLDAIEARDLLELLPRVRAAQRLVLWLQLEGYSYREICEATGKTYTWVNRHVSEGRAALRKLASG